MRNIVESRWFALADLACVVIAGDWWVWFPQAGAWPLAVALIPWGIRLAAGKFPVRRTAFDLPVVIFLLTAGIGVWAAYDRTAAWNKFWLIVAAVLLYYALATQQHRDLRMVVGFISICGAALAVFYIFSPSAIEPDTVAGILAVIFPFTVAWGLNQWGKHKMHQVTGAFVTGGLMTLAVVVSRERGVWLGLGLLAVLLPLVVRFRAVAYSRQRVIIAFGIALSCLLIGTVFAVLPATHGTIEKYLYKFSPRLEGITNTTYLAVEFPFIGGGLKAYAGLYSRYILSIPYLFQQHSHNIFLDVAVEQGWIGLAALIWILAGSGWLLLKGWAKEEEHPGQRALQAAAVCSLFLLVLHNLTEDALYSAQGVICLFVLPGLSFAVTRKDPELPYSLDSETGSVRNLWWAVIAGSGAVLIVVVYFWHFLTAAFYANLGVVEMARVHLAGWPTKLVDGERLLTVIGPAESSFQKALQYNPKQVTALYRLGMIAVERREFGQALQFLSRAYGANPNHHGIRKMLGYSYLWLGNIDKAAVYLKPDSEILTELDSYTYWWVTQNRADLSSLAQQLATRLRETRK